MHGWWWPGRQVVVIVPLLVLATAWWVDRHPPVRPGARRGCACAGFVLWGWLLVEVLQHRLTLIVDFESTRDPLARAWRALLPGLPAAGRPHLGAPGRLAGRAGPGGSRRLALSPR